MTKLSLLINEIEDKVIKENFKRILSVINSSESATPIPVYESAALIDGMIRDLRPYKNVKDGFTIYNKSTKQLESWDASTQTWVSVTESGSDAPYNGTGKYSTRFSETVTADTVNEALDEIFKFTSTNPTTALTLSTVGPREKGNTLSSMTLSVSSALGSNPAGTLTSLDFKRAGSSIYTKTSPGTSESYVNSTPITDTTVYSILLTDSEGRTANDTETITFLYPLLYLVGAASLSTSSIYSGATKILSATKARSISFTTSGQKPYYCYPATLGALTSILDQNGFETIGDWTLRSENITGLDSTAQAYYIYEFNNLTTTTMGYTFS